MSAATLWQTDDCSSLSGGRVWARFQADGSLTQECGCGWYVAWAPDPDGDQR